MAVIASLRPQSVTNSTYTCQSEDSFALSHTALGVAFQRSTKVEAFFFIANGASLSNGDFRIYPQHGDRITATLFFLIQDEDVKFSGIGDLLLDGLKDRVNGQAK